MKKILRALGSFVKKYSYEILLILMGIITGAVFAKRKREEDIFSELGNKIDVVETESKVKADEIKTKLEVIKMIKDDNERLEKLLDLWRQLDED